VTGSGGILQLEWLDLVLIQVREGNASMSFGDDVTDILDQSRIPRGCLQFTGLWDCRHLKPTGPYRKAPSYTFRHPAHGHGVRMSPS